MLFEEDAAETLFCCELVVVSEPVDVYLNRILLSLVREELHRNEAALLPRTVSGTRH